MAISSIMSALSTLAPTYSSDVSVNVRGYNDISDTLSEGECPLRMLLAPDEKVGASISLPSMTAPAQAEWLILDRLYIMPVLLNMGIQTANHKIFDYMDSYMTAIKANRCLGLTSVSVTDVSFTSPYIQSWPDAPDGIPFWVVDALVTVMEYR